MLCGQVMRDVQLVAIFCYCSPAIGYEFEARLEGLDLDSNQRVFFRFPGSTSYHMHQGQRPRDCCKCRHLKVSEPGFRRAAAVSRPRLKHS